MSEKDDKKTTFKVVDRRRFTEEGEARSGPDVVIEDRAPPPAPKPAPAPPAASAAPASPLPSAPRAAAMADVAAEPAPAKAPAGPPEDTGRLTLSVFVQSLAQQALMQLGLIPWPHGQRELDLEQARDTIDIVALLKNKTRGNLSGEEQQLLDTVLYELKMSYVEVQQMVARSRAGMKPGGMPPPPGGGR